MTHPLVTQLHFARSEFMRCLAGISDEDARKRLLPMNCISWMVGHLAVQEQFYWIYLAQGKVVRPETGEAYAVRQQLGHVDLPEFLGNMETAVYQHIE